MSKQLYEEALADVKKIKEVAEDNAKRAILEAVTPRIRDLIERELLQEQLDDEEMVDVGQQLMDQPVVTTVPTTEPASSADALSIPDAEGKVTLDLDALGTEPTGEPVSPPIFGADPAVEEFELSMESVEKLTPVVSAAQFQRSISRVAKRINELKSPGARFQGQGAWKLQIAETIAKVEDMYGYVQESIVDAGTKSSYETRLESFYKELNKLREPTMLNKNKMNESDVTLKLTGLPDELDLDAVGVDLESGDEDEAGDDMGGDEAGSDDLDLDMGDMGDEGGSEDEEVQDIGEVLNLSDDTVVEIDESMLRREIARMKALREEAVPSVAGAGVTATSMDDFGGGSDDGDPVLDHDVTTDGAEPLGEADGDADELDEMGFGTSSWGGGRGRGKETSEMDELDELGTTTSSSTSERTMPESRNRKVAFEKRLQERARRRAASIKKEAVSARAKKNVSKLNTLKREYKVVASRFNESVARVAKLVSESRSNNVARSAESKTVKLLRAKLAETNLFNAKLAYTNKLLQNPALSARQKQQLVSRLDSAKSLQEAKRVYDLTKAVKTSRQISESRDRQVLGSSSKTTRPAATLTESHESDRWAKLAGIKK